MMLNQLLFLVAATLFAALAAPAGQVQEVGAVSTGPDLYAAASSAAVTPAPSSYAGAVAEEPSAAGDGHGRDYTVTFVNSHSVAISTVHGQNPDSPTAIHNDEGFIAANATATFMLPTRWAGRLNIAPTDVPIRDRTTLLEGSFRLDGPEAVIGLDVSYVDGFTLPLVCHCGGNVRLGCNLDLLKICPAKYRINNGTCMNPWRDLGVDPNPNDFKDCEALAYTFPNDYKSYIQSIPGCQREIWCCVGTDCPPNPGQKMCPNKQGGYAHPCGSLE